jgi:hypothetical protein
VREIVIVIADLYLPRGGDEATPEAAAFAAVPGIETLGRFGVRTRLVAGWRQWLARSLGRADLAEAAPACVAAALLPAAQIAPSGAVTSWIATPVQLTAGLAHVHLDPRGILRLPAADLASLCEDFSTTFGASAFSLTPLPSGELLLRTPGIEPIETSEPARCALAGVAQALPRGPAAAALRRLIAEIEIWLHGLPLNAARRRRGEPPVTALWPWGATGRIVRAARAAAHERSLAFGRDAWLEGLWHLQGSDCRALPPDLHEVLAGARAERCVLVMEAGGELQRAGEGTLVDALSRLDARFVSPALRALRTAELSAVTLIVNDTLVRVQPHSLLKLWRRARAGLGNFT